MPINRMNLDEDVQTYIKNFEEFHERSATEDEVRLLILLPGAVAQVRSLQAHVLNNINGSGQDTAKAARYADEFLSFENLLLALNDISKPQKLEYLVGQSLMFDNEEDEDEAPVNVRRGN